MQIDIHVHSKYSKRPSQWILKKIGCPESFTEPLQLYQIAKSRGMSHVTISDHNSIDGALEIAHLNDVFISEEITTYFPDNGCKLHVLALNIDEAQHREIQRLRPNIHDLARYLHQEKILAIAAHPLYAINDRLTLAHFEQMLLMFRNFELNGARNPRENECPCATCSNTSAKPKWPSWPSATTWPPFSSAVGRSSCGAAPTTIAPCISPGLTPPSKAWRTRAC